MAKDESKEVADMLEAIARRMRGQTASAQPPAVAVGASSDDEPALGAVDLFTDERNITVTVETRNADASDVRVSVLDGRLLINLGEGARATRRDLALPAAVDEEAAVATFRNGVLDVVLPLKTNK